MKKPAVLLFLTVLPVVLPVVLPGCGDLFSSLTDPVSSDTTDSTNKDQGTSCNQPCIDARTGYAVMNYIWFLHNQNVAGQNAGRVDRTADCSLEGSVQISGTTQVASNNIETVHLVYTLSGCRAGSTHYELQMDGIVHQDGTFLIGEKATSNALTFRSDDVGFKGTVGDNGSNPVEDRCPLDIIDNGGTISGTICGRSFSY